MLAWFNEDPAILHRAVTSLKGFADRVVALDGGWDMYPDAARTSPHGQAETIQQAANQIGIEAEIWPGKTFTGQVQKRNLLLFLAAPYADWVMPLDADWELTGDREAARAELERTEADAVTVEFYTPIPDDTDLDQAAATQWHRNLAGRAAREPFLMRSLPDMRVEQHHWIYTAQKNGQRIAMWGNPGAIPQAHTLHLQAPMRILHHCLSRDQRTILANREYCESRDHHVAMHGREP